MEEETTLSARQSSCISLIYIYINPMEKHTTRRPYTSCFLDTNMYNFYLWKAYSNKSTKIIYTF
jgi:hypothetical protein